jgi:hypothetical protein
MPFPGSPDFLCRTGRHLYMGRVTWSSAYLGGPLSNSVALRKKRICYMARDKSRSQLTQSLLSIQQWISTSRCTNLLGALTDELPDPA